MRSASFPFVYFHNVPLHFMISFPPLFLLPGLDEHQVRGRNLRRGRLSTSVGQLCTCLHLTPAESTSGPPPPPALPFTSPPYAGLPNTQTHPPPKGFPSYCRGKALQHPRPQMSHRAAAAAAAALGASPRPRKSQRAELLRTL